MKFKLTDKDGKVVAESDEWGNVVALPGTRRRDTAAGESPWRSARLSAEGDVDPAAEADYRKAFSNFLGRTTRPEG